ncbi:hypothetical protein MpV1_027c [Micromonas sp. RCC1109 virus MpV1]|uniref:hypothetical protein n=1 Tax=Micromonas sp. RCC1109 virus MpV1 TaxID=880161 RepID=UPI0001EF4437|nr:hypothetical protein MpV1_027c [Micromonas sp. RCC1109 virus MpV1]ADQ90950.1 hypothetical protein MpV1_027c [Micromonas sp. RCC1109 virus MpV1]
MTDNIIIFHFYMCDVIQLLALHIINEIFKTIFWTQIRLLQVTRDDEFRPFTDTCQQHLHLIWGCVLHFIGDDECIVKCPTTHITQWFYGYISIHLTMTEILFENVVHWLRPWFHFLIHITW